MHTDTDPLMQTFTMCMCVCAYECADSSLPVCVEVDVGGCERKKEIERELNRFLLLCVNPNYNLDYCNQA